MGKGPSSATEKTTNVTTTTTTNIRDVGLTGKDAVDMATILEFGGIERTRISADLVNSISQSAGATLQQLIGGATEFGNLLVTTGADTGRGLIEAGAKIADDESDILALAPWVIGAVVVLAAIPILRK